MENQERKEQGWFPNAKVYHNGSHFIAIPHTENKRKKRSKPMEKVFVVAEEGDEERQALQLPKLEIMDDEECPECPFEEEIESYYKQKQGGIDTVNADMVPSFTKKERTVKTKKVTRGSEFKRLYEECKNRRVKEQKKYLLKGLRRLFLSDKAAEGYVDGKLMTKYRAVVERRKRFIRKAYLNEFDYFVTFTYAGGKHTEESFKKKLKNCLSHYANRFGWKYMGVWERGGDNNRLHFHALLKVPEGTMPGELVEIEDFSVKKHRRKKSVQNTYFNEKFGRTEFSKVIHHPRAYISAVEYILKYVSKTGERLVYSRGLPMYLISDINGEDVMCRTGIEDRKLVLHDKFGCWDEGEYLGVMSEETKKRMRGTTQ